MNPWFEDQLQQISSAKDVDSLFLCLTKAAKALDFDYVAYGLRTILPVSAPKVEMVNNYPSLWQEQYHQNNYLSIDPTVALGIKSHRPILWGEAVFKGAEHLWEDARSFGLEHGWAQSASSAPGIAGMITLARSGSALSDKELAEKLPYLVYFNQMSQIALQEKLLPKVIDQAQSIHLTPRQTEILKWTADGKTSPEIAIILNITERTVNHHLTLILEKLEASNKTAATVKALLLGLI